MKKALICGISGQDGAYLAQLLPEKGYQVTGTSRDAQITPFTNLRRLGIRDRVSLASMVLTDFRSVLQTLAKTQPDEIYNLAGQSSVGLSFDQPVETLESIATGNLNLLEAIRFLGSHTRLYNAGSSECFGDTGGQTADEETPFYPRSPYAVAKATAHWLVANYRDAYGSLPAPAFSLITNRPCARNASSPARSSRPPAASLRAVRRDCVSAIWRSTATGVGRPSMSMPCGACSRMTSQRTS